MFASSSPQPTSSSLSITVARDSCDLKKYSALLIDALTPDPANPPPPSDCLLPPPPSLLLSPLSPPPPAFLPSHVNATVEDLILRCQAVDSSPQSSESYSESECPPLSLSDISTATRRARMDATSEVPPVPFSSPFLFSAFRRLTPSLIALSKSDPSGP